MTNSNFSRTLLRSGTALQAIALIGAGLTASAIITAPAAAQDYTNVVASGRVQGTDGKPIAGATVEITSSAQGFKRSAVTDSSGTYKIPQTPAGSYSFTVTASGFDTFSDSNVDLTANGAGNQFTLTPSGQASSGADIIVTAGRRRVSDFEQTTTGSVISIGELSKRVPVARSLRDVILLAPGTIQGSSGQNSRFSGQASISGSSFVENAYYLNGLNITEFRQGFSPVAVPFDFYQTVEVKTGGFPAEFGRATGGVVNITTKSGSNDFHGSVLFNWEPNSLTSKNKNTYLADNDADQREREDTVFQLSGPIIKDHLFFYGIANFRNIQTGDGGTTSGTYQFASTRSPFFGGKIDAVVVDGQRLEFTIFDTGSETNYENYNYNSATNAISTYKGGSKQLDGGLNYVGRYTGTFAKWLTVSGAYGVNRNRNSALPVDTTTSNVRDYRTDATGPQVIGSNTSSSFQTNEDQRTFYRGDVDLYFKILGSHHVRFGYDREDLESTQLATPTGSAAYSLYSVKNANDVTGLPIGTQYVQARTFFNGGKFTTENEAFYAQDSWSLFSDRLTLELGLRDDRFTNRGAGGDAFYKSKDQWGPRLGLTFDPFGDGRSKVFGSFSRYFLPIASNTNIRSAGSETDYTKYNLLTGVGANGQAIIGAPITTVANSRACPDGTSGNNCVVTRDGTIQDPSTTISQSLKPQSLDEYIIGAEHRFGNRIRAQLSYTHRSLGNVLEDAAIDQAAIAYCTSKGFSAAACGNIYGGFSQYVLLNPGQPAQIKLIGLPDGTQPVVAFTAAQLGYPKATRTTDAVTLQIDREFDGNWSLSGSYTWSKTKGNYEGGADSTIGQVDTGATEAFDQPGFEVGAYGYLPGDRRHTFKLYGSYQPLDWMTVGVNGVLQSPRHFGCIGIVPESVDPFAQQYLGGGFFCQGVEVPRGSAFESQWRKQVDVSIALKLPTSFETSLRLNVLNIFNSQPGLDYNEIGDLSSGGPDTNYKKVITYQNPRSAQISLRVGF